MESRAFAALLLWIFTPACAASSPAEPEEEEDTGAAQQPEPWANGDNPTHFSFTLERRASALPASGEAVPVPWPGSYWPTWEDSINFRWDGDGSPSPAKKYETAFRVSGVEDAVSKRYGIDGLPSAKVCNSNAECKEEEEQVCGKRTGAASGRCIPKWYGICNGWAAASILFPEPQHEVVREGVTFKVQDIKALVSLVHNTTVAKFLSSRCDDSDAEGTVTYDEHGRAEPACRDTNAGTFHVVLANYTGIHRHSFIADQVFDQQVWNYPIRGYTVVEQKPVSAEEANGLLDVAPSGGATGAKTGKVSADAWAPLLSLAVTPGERYSVVMTGSGNADLYVQLGAAPTDAAFACRPALDDSRESCRGVVPAGATSLHVAVKGRAATSDYTVKASAGRVPTSYAFNRAAASLARVTTDVAYVALASSASDGQLSHRIAELTRTSRYEYVLELDANGVIIGGEWIGDSKRKHPDFLWLPYSAASPTVAGGKISYARVKALVEASVAPLPAP